MYEKHPIRVDIAGSVESIYDITKDDLYPLIGCFSYIALNVLNMSLYPGCS
jgi:hypothetical protein